MIIYVRVSFFHTNRLVFLFLRSGSYFRNLNFDGVFETHGNNLLSKYELLYNQRQVVFNIICNIALVIVNLLDFEYFSLENDEFCYLFVVNYYVFNICVLFAGKTEKFQ